MSSETQPIVWPGQPYPLGSTWDGEGVNFALYSEHAEKVELCLFDSFRSGTSRWGGRNGTIATGIRCVLIGRVTDDCSETWLIASPVRATFTHKAAGVPMPASPLATSGYPISPMNFLYIPVAICAA